MALHIVILAAGQGTRMRSDIPKVLHLLANKPLLEHVCETAKALAAEQIHVVYGYGGERVRERLAHLDVNWIEQKEQLGTGHAVEQTLPDIGDEDNVLILYGDVPLISLATLQRLLAVGDAPGLALLTVNLDEPQGYGRILRTENGDIRGIVEDKDASAGQRLIDEVNTGFMAVAAAPLKRWIAALENNNVQGEFYLTDIVALAVAEGIQVGSVRAHDALEVSGVNDRLQLAALERHYQRGRADELMRAGVSLRDPSRLDIRGHLSAGRDVEIDINVIIEGKVTLGDRVQIGANVILRDVSIGNDVKILPNCIIESSRIGNAAHIGPFARVRPESVIAEDAHLGNFVEIKKSNIGKGSKVNHLSYIGDTDLGRDANVGAGTITCNYDGANKFRTVIGDDVFIGSDTQLVAPVRVGDGATIGAGTTLTSDAPAHTLTLSRARQCSIPGWQRPRKKEV